MHARMHARGVQTTSCVNESNTHTKTQACMHARMNAWIRKLTNVHACTNTCMHTHTHTHTHSEMDKSIAIGEILQIFIKILYSECYFPGLDLLTPSLLSQIYFFLALALSYFYHCIFSNLQYNFFQYWL